MTALLFALQLAILLGLFWINRDVLRNWRLSLRREHVLARSVMTLDELLRRAVQGTLDDEELRLGMQLIDVGLRDELAAQARVGRLQRVPKIGEPWPDSMLASVLDE